MSALKQLKRQEQQNRRALIVAAAQQLFAAQDFRQVTAREIARQAGVSPGTIYRYYQNLDELFVDIFLEHAREIVRRIEVERSNGGRLSLPAFCSLYVAYLNDHMTFYQMMGHFMLCDDLSPQTAERLDPTLRSLMDQIETVVMDAGQGEQTRLTAHALFSALNGAMISYARYPGRSLGEIRRHTLRLADIIAGCFGLDKAANGMTQ
jgi:AcrR family transcriptional regulator